jgi:hypothetical protein
MGRIVRLLIGAIIAAAGALVLMACSYTLYQAFTEGAYRQMLYPAGFAVVSAVALLAGLRTAMRAILPGSALARVIMVAIIVAVALHAAGYASLSSDTLKEYADRIQTWLRSLPQLLGDA